MKFVNNSCCSAKRWHVNSGDKGGRDFNEDEVCNNKCCSANKWHVDSSGRGNRDFSQLEVCK